MSIITFRLRGVDELIQFLEQQRADKGRNRLRRLTATASDSKWRPLRKDGDIWHDMPNDTPHDMPDDFEGTLSEPTHVGPYGPRDAQSLLHDAWAVLHAQDEVQIYHLCADPLLTCHNIRFHNRANSWQWIMELDEDHAKPHLRLLAADLCGNSVEDFIRILNGFPAIADIEEITT